MLTRWVGAALLFVLVWAGLVTGQILIWTWRSVRPLAGAERPSSSELRARVAGATQRGLGWLRWAAGWDD